MEDRNRTGRLGGHEPGQLRKRWQSPDVRGREGNGGIPLVNLTDTTVVRGVRSHGAVVAVRQPDRGEQHRRAQGECGGDRALKPCWTAHGQKTVLGRGAASVKRLLAIVVGKLDATPRKEVVSKGFCVSAGFRVSAVLTPH